MLFLPNNMDELKDSLKKVDKDVVFLSGCTDAVLMLRKNDHKCMVDLSAIEDLKGIKHDEEIYIGAGTSLSDIIESDIIKTHAPILCAAADQVGSTQIRNAATLGGNVANAFAGADMIPPLYALEANVHILGPDHERLMAISDFVLDNRVNALEAGEIVQGISFKPQKKMSYFGKIGSRTRVTISKLNMAALVGLEDDQIKDASIAFGALGRTAFRANEIEDYLVGKKINELGNHQIYMDLVDEKIPTRSSRHYKREAIAALADGLLKELRG